MIEYQTDDKGFYREIDGSRFRPIDVVDTTLTFITPEIVKCRLLSQKAVERHKELPTLRGGYIRRRV